MKVMYAGFWLRFFAYIIDITLIAAATAAILRPVFATFSLPVNVAFLSIYGIGGLVMFLLYFILMTKLTNGQTLGKRIMGLRVISLDEEKISWKTTIFREGICRYFLQAFPGGILYVVAAFTEKKQGLGDLFCDTYVVKDEVYELINSLDENGARSTMVAENVSKEAGGRTSAYSSESTVGYGTGSTGGSEVKASGYSSESAASYTTQQPQENEVDVSDELGEDEKAEKIMEDVIAKIMSCKLDDE